jgi:hypothetical protein
MDDPTSQDHVMASSYLNELNKHTDKEVTFYSKPLIPMKDAPLVGGKCLQVYSRLSYSPLQKNTHTCACAQHPCQHKITVFMSIYKCIQCPRENLSESAVFLDRAYRFPKMLS